MTSTERDAFLNESFPVDFQWASSSESFKVEGGWAEDGKGESIWDRFGHDGLAFANQTADLACDSYYKVDYDVYLLRGLHVNTYQFSISWARIFPSGHRGSQSEKGALYYDKLINALIDSGIQPVVTLYHWDLPQALQDCGGWTNASIVEAFKDYADFCFSRFGDRVKTWNTFSSPWVVSHAGYGTGEHAPGVKDYVVASYQATHNMIKSHAEAWHVYNEKYRKTQGGRAEPVDPSRPEDIAAADRYLQFMLGWFAHPIFVDGDYPAAFKTQIEQKRNECPLSEPARLPVFTAEERKRIHGTADFFGLNHYTSRLVNNSVGGCTPGPQGVGNFQSHVDPSWSSTASDWIYSAPWGLRRLLNYISTEYLNIIKVPIHITGNGMPTEHIGDSLNDVSRIDYMKSYINEALKAIHLDGVNVQRFTVQSLMDVFEGPQGYSDRFGLHHVNFDLPDWPRTPKQSAYFYSSVIKNNGFAAKKLFFYAPELKNTESKQNTSIPPSTVPSQARVVWRKFSSQTNFQRKLYHHGTFPQGFSWGVSSSAYQIEGGWNADGKGPSVWDTFTQNGSIPDNANGDVACDSYHRLEEDFYMLRALKDLSEAEESDSPTTAISKQRAVAWGLRRLLNWIKEEYGDPEIYITENGVATDITTTVDDIDRVFYYKTYVDEALKAHNLDDDEKILYGEFPKTFNWSTASASYQIEGSWRADGKGLSIWDKFAHTPLKVSNSDNGDISCDRIDKDVEVLKKLKVTHYRFSVSWPRVLPDGTTNHVNEAGVNYYHRLLDALEAANIQPQLTLYHWDLPLALQKVEGWENETIVQRFRGYADLLFSRFGRRVKFWITLNEPYIVANLRIWYICSRYFQ
ncbi:Lactase-phlorizin hydrolase [Dissostichus eleginoides]|uniref:beta-glucosidase n=1 Tax=Dissostichus eleginoides TaxID=100907 RepID=A0AAD9CLQ6_DISEL|nr:Lactase-phlorizin hydrolase [Dissostichus eleginoides]